MEPWSVRLSVSVRVTFSVTFVSVRDRVLSPSSLARSRFVLPVRVKITDKRE